MESTLSPLTTSALSAFRRTLLADSTMIFPAAFAHFAPSFIPAQDGPLDLSAKILAAGGVRQASVIQHTKEVVPDGSVLPTCLQPKVDLQRLRRASGANLSYSNETRPTSQSDANSSSSAANRMSYPREVKETHFRDPCMKIEAIGIYIPRPHIGVRKTQDSLTF